MSEVFEQSPRRARYEVVGEAIAMLHRHLGLWAAAILIYMVISSIIQAPLQVIQQIELESLLRENKGRFDPLFMVRPPLIWYYLASFPLYAFLYPFMAGIMRMALRCSRRGTPDLGDMFAFDGMFWQLALCGLLMAVLTTIGFLLFVIPGMVAYALMTPSFLLILEKKMGAIEAIKTGARAVWPSVWTVVAINLVSGLYGLLGALLCCVGVVLTAATIEISAALVYRDLFEEPLPPAVLVGAESHR